MTIEQKTAIHNMRTAGASYRQIADKIGVTKDAVRSYCRNHTQITQPKSESESSPLLFCPQCGAPVAQTSHRKKKRFCSAKCCQAWWNTHPAAVNKKAVYHFTCACCGKAFTAYGNANRKYCSHVCYIQDRYKGGISTYDA